MEKRLEGINYIRIGCMITILLFHSRIHYGLTIGLTILDEFISIGAVAVIGFFMVSGFCLRKKYHGINIIRTGRFGNYIKKRLIGIYPIFLFLLLCTLIFNYRLGSNCIETLKILPMELSLLHVLLNPVLHGYFFNDNFWYISTLFILYLVFPYCNEIADGINRKKRWILCMVLPITSWYIYYLNIYPPGNAFLFYYTNPLFRIPEFFVGILATDIVDQEEVKVQWWQLVRGTILLGIIVHFLNRVWSSSYNLYNIVIIPYFFLLLLAVGTMKDSTIIAVIARSRIIKYITEIGLSVYLSQSISIMMLEKWGGTYLHNTAIAFIVLTIIIAIFLHEVVEKPSRKFLHTLMKGRRKNE